MSLFAVILRYPDSVHCVCFSTSQLLPYLLVAALEDESAVIRGGDVLPSSGWQSQFGSCVVLVVVELAAVAVGAGQRMSALHLNADDGS